VAAAAAQADRIRTASGIGYEGQITGLRAEGIVIKKATGESVAVPLSQIKEVVADKFPDLTKAEDAYAKGDPKSIAEAEWVYRSILGSGAPDWLRLLVHSRMYKFYCDSGRLPDALDAYLELARAEPRLVTGLKLPSPNPTASEANQVMLGKVKEALQSAGNQPYVTELKNLQVTLVVLEGKPEEALPLIQPMLKSSDARVRAMAMVKQVELLVRSKKFDEAAKRLDEAVPLLDPSYAPDVAFWRGQILKEQGKFLDAAVEWMRLPILYPTRDRNRTAEALWLAGQAMEAAKVSRPEVVKVYKEAVDRYAGTAGAEKANRELIRLGAL
jgi:tetratricopeptide (TPR) repeat protein